MSAGAQLSVTDMRRAARHPVNYPVIAEHNTLGEIDLHICNISANGFMIDNAKNLSRGDRLIVRLPIVGRIEAYTLWIREERAGMQLERIIRVEDFEMVIDALQPNPKLRRSR